MKYIYAIIKLAILFILMFLAFKNTHTVTFNWGYDQSIEWPLLVFLFIAFVVGAFFGIFAMLSRVLSLRHKLSHFKKLTQKQAKEMEKYTQELNDISEENRIKDAQNTEASKAP